MRIILASGSPRRKELLSREGISFTVIPAEGDEVIRGTEPAEIVRNLSYNKASEVADRVAADKADGKSAGDAADDNYVVIGADTVVSYKGKILGKPADHEEAAAMLRMLNGGTHQVYTGVTVICVKNGYRTEKVFHECTDVVFREVPDEDIIEYASSEEPMDKAGAYAIQGSWGKNIREIHGDYDNVVGLPVKRVVKELEVLC